LNELTYEVLAELSIIYATKIDQVYKGLFFDKTKSKFLKELKYLKEETLYKILWSLVKSEELKIKDNSIEWQAVK
jgi:hypothetical protein